MRIAALPAPAAPVPGRNSPHAAASRAVPGRPEASSIREGGGLDAVFAALADPTRRAILAMLLEDDMAVSDVAAPFTMSLAAVSKHLAVLAAAGLIRQQRRGRITWCALEPEAMRAASVWMRGFGHLDPLDLDDFERFLAAELATAGMDADRRPDGDGAAPPPGDGGRAGG